MNRQIFHDTSLFLKNKINLLAIGFCGLSVAGWMLLDAQRYYYFCGVGGWDTAYNTQMLHNLIYGKGLYSSFLGANFLVDHCYYFVFLLAPFYWICHDPLFLKYSQIWAFFAGTYIFFIILKKRSHPFIALGGMVAFSLAPANIAMLRSCFNCEAFAIPFIFLIFKAFDEQRYIVFLVFCCFLSLVKEQMPLVVMMFGILALFIKKENKFKWALVPLLLGLTVFIVDVFVIIPYACKNLPVGQNIHWGLYSLYGKTPGSIFLHLLAHPSIILKKFVTTKNIKWYTDLWGMWGSLALLSPQILLPALPLFLKTILSKNPNEHDVLTLYYASVFTPYVFLAAWTSLNQIQNKNRLIIHSLALTMMFIHALTFAPKWVPVFKNQITTSAMIEQHFLNKIPEDAPLIADMDYYRNWKDLYFLNFYLTGKSASGNKFKLPDDVEYLLINLSDNTLKKDVSKLMTAQNFYDRWRLDESIENWALYVKNTSQNAQTKLIDISKRPFPDKNVSLMVGSNTIGFDGITFPEKFPQKYRIFPVSTYWECFKKPTASYQIFINIFGLNGGLYYVNWHPIGSTIYPTNFWRKGEYVKESYFYLLPHLPQGKFIIKIAVYNPVNKKLEGPITKILTIENCDTAKQTPP